MKSAIAATRTRVRLDGAFYDKAIIEPLEQHGIGYVVVARMYQPLKRRMVEARYMETILWAYDLVLAFQMLCLPEDVQHWNISTLRRELWWLAAEWVRRHNRNILILPATYPRQDLFVKIQKATAKVRPLI